MTSFIIVSFNTSEFTVNTIRSIIEKCSDYEIIVVDNNSSDDTVEKIRLIFKNEIGVSLKLVASSKNNGFSKGNNIGANMARGDYLCFINPDTVVVCDLSKGLTNFIKAERKNIIVSPQIINPDLTEQHCTNTFPVLNLHLFFSHFLKKNRKKIKKVDWLTGVCLFMKKETFDALGGWNEEFALYSEDLDICYRLKKYLRGNCLLNTNIKLIHYGNQSGKKVYKTQYDSLKRKFDSLRIFYKLYYNDKKFWNWIKFLYRLNKDSNLLTYIEENKK